MVAGLLGGAATLAFGASKNAASAAAAAASALPRYGVAVYADLCQDPRSGDMGGQRIVLHRFAEGDSVTYEYTAGALSWPVQASDVVIDDRTGVLNFNVPGDGQAERTVIGRFGNGGRTLTLQGGYCADASLPMTLSLLSQPGDFSRKLPACKACPPGQEMQGLPDAPALQPSTMHQPDRPDDNSPTLEQQEMLDQAQPLKKYDVPAPPPAR